MLDNHEMTSGRKHKVLIVDDDLMMRRSMASMLQSSGYEVLTAENGREGLEKFDRENPDVMLLDLRMPKMDGIKVLSALGDKINERPVIIVSGVGSVDDAIKTLQLGAWDYIVKPINDLIILQHAINRAIGRAALIRENKRYQLYLEEEVKKRTAELHQAQKMEAIGTLAGGIAHDFNNLLSVMIGYSEMALYQLPENDRVREDIEKVMAAGSRATELVRQILTFSRQTEQERKPVKVQYVLKEILKFLKASFPSTIQLQQHIEMQCETIMADPTQIHQVIMNLCTNARHAMAETEGVLRVELSQVNELPPGLLFENRGREHDQFVRLIIADNGYGMDQEQIHRIFDPFYTTKKIGEGTGLGLSVVHGIVKQLDGNILVNSEKGEGTEFQVFFPVTSEEPVEDHESSPFLYGENERILVVDDEPEVAEMQGRVLGDLGYRAQVFTDSEKALTVFREDPGEFDLILTDMTMPNLTGKDLAMAMLAMRPEIPIIMCTGFSEIIDEEKAKSLGIKEFIMKPVVKKELSRIVRKVLDNG